MLITVIATGFGMEKKQDVPTAAAAAQVAEQPAVPAQQAAPEFISQSTRTRADSGSIFTGMNPETVDFASTKFGQSFVSVFEKATQAAQAEAPATVAPVDFTPVQAPAQENPAAAQSFAQPFDVIETPAKKSGSIFDDPDEDESDVLPVFKGRNIFGNN